LMLSLMMWLKFLFIWVGSRFDPSQNYADTEEDKDKDKKKK